MSEGHVNDRPDSEVDAPRPVYRRWEDTTIARELIARLSRTEKHTGTQWWVVSAGVLTSISLGIAIMVQTGACNGHGGWEFASHAEVAAVNDKVDAIAKDVKTLVDQGKRNGRR